jgi:peptidoglycan/LPS O-acetylase OafA/YrhL
LEIRKEIVSHTSLRGIAALLVVAYHLQFISPRLPVEDATAFFRQCYLLVDFFFLLSGFIISFVYAAEFQAGKIAWRDVLSFWIKRISRLYPLVLFCLAYMVIIRLGITVLFVALGKPLPFDGSPASLQLLAGQALMVNAWMPNPDGWNTPSWSISAEFFAYAMFPLIIMIGLRLRWIMTVAMLAGSGFFYAYHADVGGLDIIGGLAPFRCLAGFVLGMLLFNARKLWDHLPDIVLSLVQLVAILAAMLCFVLPLNDIIAIPFFAILIGATWQDRGLIPHWLNAKPWRYLGKISFSVYLNHVPLLGFGHMIWSRIAEKLPLNEMLERIIFIIAIYGAVLIVSHFTYYRIEEPGRRLFSRKLNGWLFRGDPKLGGV